MGIGKLAELDSQLDACMHPLIRKWDEEPTALQILEVLDKCIYSSIAFPTTLPMNESRVGTYLTQSKPLQERSCRGFDCELESLLPLKEERSLIST